MLKDAFRACKLLAHPPPPFQCWLIEEHIRVNSPMNFHQIQTLQWGLGRSKLEISSKKGEVSQDFYLRFFFYIPLKIYKTNYLLQYLLITLRNTTRTIIPRGALDYDNPVAINIERNKNYRVNQERCTTRPQSRTQGPPTDSHNSLRIYDAFKRLSKNHAQASVEEFGIRII